MTVNTDVRDTQHAGLDDISDVTRSGSYESAEQRRRTM